MIRRILSYLRKGTGESSYRELGRRIGVHVVNLELLELALRHRSSPASKERSTPITGTSNERLEFLGDAVLNMLVAQHLYERFPAMSEGELTKLRSRLVSTKALAMYSRQIELRKWLDVSPSAERALDRGSENMLADAFEAVLAAAYLDGGLRSAKKIVKKIIIPQVNLVKADPRDDNYKSQLLELSQASGTGTPRYFLSEEEGPDHDRTFTVQVFVKDNLLGEGRGKSKKDAEQKAAANAVKVFHTIVKQGEESSEAESSDESSS